MGSVNDQINGMNSSIAGLRTAGGDVVVSFGGAAGTEMAIACTDNASLKAAYLSVINKYSVKRIDFDIEGAAQSDHAANTRRAQVIKAIQAERPSGNRLTVTYTLPVLPTGLTADGLGVLQDTVAVGPQVDLVNVMAMDYGTANSAMGQAAIDAASNTAGQLDFVYPRLTPTQRLAHVGVTPMIGENDVAHEVFTSADATKVGNWVRDNKVGGLFWWSVARDTPCPNNGTYVSGSCSGTSNPAWAYASAFRG